MIIGSMLAKCNNCDYMKFLRHQGAVQLGGPDPWYDLGVAAKVWSQSFLLTESSLVVKIKNTQLVLLSQLIWEKTWEVTNRE